ncbi:hypothetical protein [Kribbella sp. CA-294648]|uniref:hypothetical protein n=1 Tax=Kribbella sp. CA-294648 TaxID=3239948 RepID=UPI003D8ABA3C
MRPGKQPRQSAGTDGLAAGGLGFELGAPVLGLLPVVGLPPVVGAPVGCWELSSVTRLEGCVLELPALSSEPPVKRLTTNIPDPSTTRTTTTLNTTRTALLLPFGGGGGGGGGGYCWYCG